MCAIMRGAARAGSPVSPTRRNLQPSARRDQDGGRRSHGCPSVLPCPSMLCRTTPVSIPPSSGPSGAGQSRVAARPGPAPAPGLDVVSKTAVLRGDPCEPSPIEARHQHVRALLSLVPTGVLHGGTTLRRRHDDGTLRATRHRESSSPAALQSTALVGDRMTARPPLPSRRFQAEQCTAKRRHGGEGPPPARSLRCSVVGLADEAAAGWLLPAISSLRDMSNPVWPLPHADTSFKRSLAASETPANRARPVCSDGARHPFS